MKKLIIIIILASAKLSLYAQAACSPIRARFATHTGWVAQDSRHLPPSEWHFSRAGDWSFRRGFATHSRRVYNTHWLGGVGFAPLATGL